MISQGTYLLFKACTAGCNICTSAASTACLACGTGNLYQGSCVIPCPAGFSAWNKVCIGKISDLWNV